MALIKCPDCAGTVSDRASACPHCGHPVVSPPASMASRSLRAVRSNDQSSSDPIQPGSHEVRLRFQPLPTNMDLIEELEAAMTGCNASAVVASSSPVIVTGGSSNQDRRILPGDWRLVRLYRSEPALRVAIHSAKAAAIGTLLCLATLVILGRDGEARASEGAWAYVLLIAFVVIQTWRMAEREGFAVVRDHATLVIFTAIVVFLVVFLGIVALSVALSHWLGLI